MSPATLRSSVSLHRCAWYAAALLLALAAEAGAMDSARWTWTPSPLERVRLIGLQVIAVVYVFTLGATLGSFLNVVIYRLPRGMDIVRPRSRCPACRTPIALWDNIPVLSWLVLRGKCRTCLSPISLRYPLVEAAVGGILLLLFWLEVVWGGPNLPLREAAPFDFLSWRLPWESSLLAIYHAWLLVTLLVMALVQWDRHLVPRVIVRLAMLVGLLLPVAWPDLRPLGVLPWTDSLGQRAWWQGGIDGLAGAGLGWLIGCSLAPMLRRSQQRRGGRESFIHANALIGAFLGWQAALDIGVFCLMAMIVTRLAVKEYPRLLTVPPLAWPALACCFYVPLWKHVWLVGRWLMG
jgi:leader peptidase (prepilin peptidase)/N-methyltransferase